MYNYKLKLNLGCGDRYLQGYTNIDFPESKTVQKRKRKPDIIADFTKLEYPRDYFEEINLYHVFEHFMRYKAVGLICQFNKMLMDNGILIIAVPDVEACMKEFISASKIRQLELIRHMWGSHEAEWAVHREGWFRWSLQNILEACGFILKYEKINAGQWPEVIITGEKLVEPNKEGIKNILKIYDYGDGMLNGWMTYINGVIDD